MENKVELFSCSQPCSNCPYRKDAPLKLWHRSEYQKLLRLESSQFGAIYNCHKNNGSICVGWFMKQLENGCPSIALRIAMIKRQPLQEYIKSLHSPSPLFKNVKAMIRANYPSVVRKTT